MPKYSTLLLSLAAAGAKAEFEKIEVADWVTVTEGPTECGEDKMILPHKFVRFHYDGIYDESTENGEPETMFDSTQDRQPAETFADTPKVIKGISKGLLGLCEGAFATLLIPPEMGYGEEGGSFNNVVGNATLRYEIEILQVADEHPGPMLPNAFKNVDRNKDMKLSADEIEVYFEKIGRPMPMRVMDIDDTDSDGFISYDEFNGSKGLEEDRIMPPPEKSDFSYKKWKEDPLYKEKEREAQEAKAQAAAEAADKTEQEAKAEAAAAVDAEAEEESPATAEL